MAEAKKPESFADLNEQDLKVAAEFYGTEVGEKPAVTVANLVEDGVDWELYTKDFLTKKEEPVEEDNGVVTSKDVTLKVEEDDAPVVEEFDIVTAPEHPQVAGKEQRYLIKMERENPTFQFRQYKFSQANPYALMTPADANDILMTEDNFRQAHPSEVEEFYS